MLQEPFLRTFTALTPGQAFGLRAVASITVDGTEYPFAMVEETDF